MVNSNSLPTAPKTVEQIIEDFFMKQSALTISSELLALYDLMVESKEYVHERNLTALRAVSDTINLIGNLQTHFPA